MACRRVFDRENGLLNLLPSLRRVLYFALAEIRTARRLARFPALIVVLALLSGFGYVFSCLTMAYVAPFTSSFGGAVPLYLLGNIDPTVVLTFHIALLLLAFDASHRHARNRIEEVLNAKPISNFELLAGRTLGFAFLVWLAGVLFVAAMQVTGLIALATGWQYAGVLQFHSIVNLLLVDAPATLFLWCSIVVFLSSLLRLRLAVVVVSAALMFGAMLLVVVVPYSLLPIASPISNDSLFVSDLVPQFAKLSSILVRCAFVLAGFGLLVLGSICVNRSDQSSLFRGAMTATVLFAACFAAFAPAALEVPARQAEKERWRSAHAAASQSAMPDLTRLSGSVRIDPGSKLEVDLVLDFVSDGSDSLVFTFNPAMRIRELELNGAPQEYSFANGLLQVQRDTTAAHDSAQKLRIVAQGIPNPRFGTFDATLDYESDPTVPNRVVRFFGTDGSVFDSRYVALMPNTYWHPSPGAVSRDYSSTQQGLDYFEVDLEVELIATDWTLVGSGITEPFEESGSYRVYSATPVPEVGLFASSFKSTSVAIEEAEFSLHIHRRHDEPFDLPKEAKTPLEAMADAMTGHLTELGLDLPQSRLSIVEVPARLRTVGGGWRMDSLAALPGIMLISERGLSTAKLGLARRQLERVASDDTLEFRWSMLLVDHIRYGLGTMNFWKTVPEHHWTHATSASGPDAHALDQIVRSLVSAESAAPHEFFSVHSSVFAGPLALLNPELAASMAGASAERISWGVLIASDTESNYSKRLSTRESVETIALSSLPGDFDNQQILELSLLKCSEIAKQLLRTNDKDSIFNWISDMRRRFAGMTYSRDDLLAVAEEHNIVVHPFLTDWLTAEEVPAFAFSKPTVRRIADGERGSPRHETSFDVRNTASVDGYVSIQFPTEESVEWMFPSMSTGINFRIDGNTSKQLNLTTEQRPYSVYVNPMLSRNRGTIRIELPEGEIEEDRLEQPRPEEVASDWTPADSRIVVDDLDPGFAVEQPEPKIQKGIPVGWSSWYTYSLEMNEMDHGLIWSGDQYDFTFPMDGQWGRLGASGSYGKYRRTYAIQWDWRKQFEQHAATFLAELPQTSTWQLEFYKPSGLYWLQGASDPVLLAITVENDGETLDTEFDLNKAEVGWNTVGEYDLSGGEAKVYVSRPSDYAVAIADAIRWTDLNGASSTGE